MSETQNDVIEFIKDNTGITVSKMLYSHIMHPKRLDTLNNVALKEIVMEYAPIYQRFRHWLDGPIELSIIISFSLALSCRIAHKPELQMILDKSE